MFLEANPKSSHLDNESSSSGSSKDGIRMALKKEMLQAQDTSSGSSGDDIRNVLKEKVSQIKKDSFPNGLSGENIRNQLKATMTQNQGSSSGDDIKNALKEIMSQEKGSSSSSSGANIRNVLKKITTQSNLGLKDRGSQRIIAGSSIQMARQAEISQPKSRVIRPESPDMYIDDFEVDTSTQDKPPRWTLSPSSRKNPPSLDEPVNLSNLPQRETFISTKLADPMLWSDAYEHIKTATPGHRLHPEIVDLFLLKLWYGLVEGQNNRHAYYFNMITARKIHDHVLEDSIHATLLLQPGTGIPMKPVLFSPDYIGGSMELTMALFDYNNNVALIFGHGGPYETVMHASWEEWEGSVFWKAFANLFGWETRENIKIIQPNWIKNEHDTESWIALLCQTIFDDGWVYSTDINGHPVQPSLGHCVHNMRERIFHTTLQICQESYQFWSKFHHQIQYPHRPKEDVVEDMKTGILNLQKLKMIALELAEIRFMCQSCYHDGSYQPHLALETQHVQEYDDNSDENENNNPSNHHSIVLPIQSSPRLPAPEIQLPEIQLPDNLQVDRDEDSSKDSLDDLEDFDDYESALLVSNDDRADIIPNAWTFNSNGMLVLTKHWSLWRDRGYRLRSDFFSMFKSHSPVMVQDHLLPYQTSISESEPLAQPRSPSIPLLPLVPYSPSPSAISPSPSLPPSPRLSTTPHLPQLPQPQSQSPRPSSPVPQYDLIQMGAEEMFDEAGRTENTSESRGVFVNGLSRDGKFIQLDLEKDRVEIPDEDVVLSCDIDSVIWVTPTLRFNGPVYIHFLPPIGDKPPFSVNNHIYVQVLPPPSKEDRESHRISQQTWSYPLSAIPQSYPLSAIPHTDFGHVGDGSGQFNIYVFFPRMIRRNHETGRMSTLIPREVQDLWFSEVVIPAFHVAMEGYPGTMEYLPMSLELLRLQQGGRQKKSIPLTADTIPEFQSALSKQLSQKPNLLGRFGSFFFVLDSRGIKLLTKQCAQANEKLEFLCNSFPQLDWIYMSDRLNGELFLDLGISYHPPDDENLVGLWRLDKLQESYEIMGMKKGTTHHTSTLARYGGKQAEMKITRSEVVHLCFRSSYNLCFEVVRLPGQANYLCTDTDAVKVNDKFLTGCKNWKKLFQNAQTRSYGVRDEVRGSGLAINELLDIALKKAKDYLDSKPIIWIRSELFFTFLTRRLVELENVQLALARNRPQNYGTMSTLVIHLIRHIMVTPQVKHTFLREALRDLRFDSIMERFRVFFLHDLKLKSGVLWLRELPVEDSAEVIHLYGASLKKSARTIADRPHQLVRVPQQGYPWGPDPSWIRIQQLLETEPQTFLGEWKQDESWIEPEELQTQDLFVQFTTQLWLCIRDSFASEGVLPNPSTLEEAMETWTVSKIQDILGADHCLFLPSSNGLLGKLPPNHRLQPSFSQRRTIFFPPPTDDIDDNSIWYPYTLRGYIHDYHQYLERWNDDQAAIDQLHDGLDNIFGQLQCLPLNVHQSRSKSIWSATSGKIKFITNSKYYRIREVGSTVAGGESRAGGRPQISKGALQKRLTETLGGQVEKQVRNRTRRKSAKTLKKRNPPVRKDRVNQPAAKKNDPATFQRITRSKARLARETLNEESSCSEVSSVSGGEEETDNPSSSEKDMSDAVESNGER